MEQGSAPVASTSQVELTTLPYITVQHDLQEVIQEVTDGTVSAESFWVSVYRNGSTTVHGKVLVRQSLHNDGEVEFESEGGVEFERVSGSQFLIACLSLKVPQTVVKMPRQNQKSLLSTGIDCMDVSPDGSRYIVGGKDGALRVGSARSDLSSHVVMPKGHVGDILSCRFFPSSQVVISTSSDLTSRIFSAADGSNPRTLSGHTAAVTDVAIIERGKHVLTTSNDGTLKLWLVGEAKCLKTWRVGKGARKKATKVLCFDCATARSATDDEDSDPLKQKMAAVALENGSVALVDIASAGSDLPVQTVPMSEGGQAVSALASIRIGDSMLLAAGTIDGLVAVFKVNMTNIGERAEVLHRMKRNNADITALSFDVDSASTSPHLLVCTMDGLLYQVALPESTQAGAPTVAVEYAGYDIDACNAIVKWQGEVYAAGKDGHLKRY